MIAAHKPSGSPCRERRHWAAAGRHTDKQLCELAETG
jgi:hypothetical protein